MKNSQTKTAAQDPYLENNRGFITASKLKLFTQCPYSYYLKYEREEEIGGTSGVHFGVGTAVDDFVSYGKEFFDNKYEIAEKGKRQTDLKKIYFSYSDGAPILRVIAEMKRQPFFALHNLDHEMQVEIKGKWKDLQIKGTLDVVNIKNMTFRDTKTTAGKGFMPFSRVCKNAIKDFDYVFSMSFYDILFSCKYGEFAKSRILDFFGKGEISKYYPIELTEDVIDEGRKRVIDALQYFKKCKESKNFPMRRELFKNNPEAYLEAPFYGYSVDSIATEAAPFQEGDFS